MLTTTPRAPLLYIYNTPEDNDKLEQYVKSFLSHLVSAALLLLLKPNVWECDDLQGGDCVKLRGESYEAHQASNRMENTAQKSQSPPC